VSPQQVIYSTSTLTSNNSKFRRKSTEIATRIVASSSDPQSSVSISPIIQPYHSVINRSSTGTTEHADGHTSEASPTGGQDAVGNSLTGSISGKSVTLDIDDVITRLINAGNGKVGKTVPLKSSEVLTVLHVAREIILSQPALIELTPPVKIVGMQLSSKSYLLPHP
jgi:serine/threonine-protein phosphatase PP1 catalytic subunit